jgi:dihydrofolate reductase
MKLSIIVAAAENNAIGKDNHMLWNLPEDMRFFKNTTWGMPLIMGRKTFEALGNKPLPGRFNIVISRRKEYESGHAEVLLADSLFKAIDLAKKTDAKEAFIGGGGQLYKESLLLCDTIYVTRVFANIEGDAFFPEIPLDVFQLTSSKKVSANDTHAYNMDFQTWTKIKSVPEHAG